MGFSCLSQAIGKYFCDKIPVCLPKLLGGKMPKRTQAPSAARQRGVRCSPKEAMSKKLAKRGRAGNTGGSALGAAKA